MNERIFRIPWGIPRKGKKEQARKEKKKGKRGKKWRSEKPSRNPQGCLSTGGGPTSTLGNTLKSHVKKERFYKQKIKRREKEE